MQGLGKMLRGRAAILGLTDSEVARRLGMSQARYHNYVSDVTEPDLTTVVRICRVLDTSPDQLLGVASGGDAAPPNGDDVQRGRVASALSALQGEGLAFVADLVEAVVAVQRGRGGQAPPRPRGGSAGTPAARRRKSISLPD